MRMADHVVTLPQRCRCGGSGEMCAVYEVDTKESKRIGYMAKCQICGAATETRKKMRAALLDWMDRKCPSTFHDTTHG